MADRCADGHSGGNPTQTNLTIPVILPADLVARLDGMADTLRGYSPLPQFGEVDRAFVIRMAILSGLDALDREYGEPTLG